MTGSVQNLFIALVGGLSTFLAALVTYRGAKGAAKANVEKDAYVRARGIDDAANRRLVEENERLVERVEAQDLRAAAQDRLIESLRAQAEALREQFAMLRNQFDRLREQHAESQSMIHSLTTRLAREGIDVDGID